MHNNESILHIEQVLVPVTDTTHLACHFMNNDASHLHTEKKGLVTMTSKTHITCHLMNHDVSILHIEQVLVTVTDNTQMAVQLINVIGLRLAQVFILDANAVSVARQSSLPASLMTWLKVLVRQNNCFASIIHLWHSPH